MKIKALVSFAGSATMAVGEIKDVPDEIAADVIRCGFAAPAEEPAEEPVEKPTEEAAEEPAEKPAKKSRAKKAE